MSLYHRWIQVQAYKHDGSFHRLWSHGLIVRDDDDYIVLGSNRVRVIESDNHKWRTKEKAIFIFSKKEWFNVIVTFKEDGIHYYVNIASPSIVDDKYIKFIDYDLDIKAFPSGFSKILDVNEFNSHCNKYGYSDELKKVLEKSLNDNINKFNNKIDPFNEEIINKYLKDFEDFTHESENKNKEVYNNENHQNYLDN